MFKLFCTKNKINQKKFKNFIMFKYLYHPLAIMQSEYHLKLALKNYLSEQSTKG